MEGQPKLGSGGAFADLSDWRKIGVYGSEALLWLDSLLTASVGDLAPGRARRALLLSAAGGVRADVTVTIAGGNVLVIQDPAQQRSIMGLLQPHIGEWSVDVDDRSDALSLFSFPGSDNPPEAPGVAYCAPSCLGEGIDLIALMSDRQRLRGSLGRGWRLASAEDVLALQAATGVPRVGIDLPLDRSPLGTGLETAVELSKEEFVGRDALIAGADSPAREDRSRV